LLKIAALAFVLLYLAPIAIPAALYASQTRGDWRAADRLSTSLLLPAATHPRAIVRIFSARTVSWPGIIATHSWIVVKDAGASAYQRLDFTAWSQPTWIDRFVPDGHWFESVPDTIVAANGPAAEAMIPRIRATIRTYRYAQPGDYTV
jgi:hypothetical protein